MLQHDRQLKVIAKAIEKKIKSELEKMMESDRDRYEKVFDAFGIQLKYGLYSDYGAHKDVLTDLLLFKNSGDKRYMSLKEYKDGMKEGQKAIYYAAGETESKIEMLPKTAAVKAQGYEILYLTDDVDEFALRMLGKYGNFEFKNVTDEDLDLISDEERENVKRESESAEDMLKLMKEAIGKVSAVKFTASLGDYPVSLSSEGELSLEMAKTLKKMPGTDGAPDASVVLEVNVKHPIKEKLTALYETDKESLGKYAKILFAEACLVSGMPIENPKELTELITELMV